MDPADVDALAEFCRDRAGDQVRAVGHVSEGEVVPTYMRDDLQRRYTEAELRGLEDAATGAAGTIAGMNTYNTSLGQSHGGLFVFEDAFLLRIPDRSGEAASVSLDRSVSEGLSAFIKECRHDCSPPTTVPTGRATASGDDRTATGRVRPPTRVRPTTTRPRVQQTGPRRTSERVSTVSRTRCGQSAAVGSFSSATSSSTSGTSASRWVMISTRRVSLSRE